MPETESAYLARLEAQNRKLRKQIKQLKAARKKMEFSKIIFVGVSIGTVAITVFSCRMIWLTQNTEALAYLIPAVFAEMASATGFYYSKAKAENKIKLSRGGTPEPPEDSDEVVG